MLGGQRAYGGFVDTDVDIVASLRRFGAESAAAEAKDGRGGLPRSIRETLSSFSNTPGGGSIVIGVAETKGFPAVGVPDPSRMMADLASMCSDQMQPPVRANIYAHDVDGKTVVIAEVPELPRTQKPCFVKSVGLERGSYIRVADGDRRLTSEEIQQIVADRGQPLFDQEAVVDASMADLDPPTVDNFVARMREANARVFRDQDRDSVLRMTKAVITTPDGAIHPTLAGLLALGRYPQQFFPQLNVTFVHYPTPSGESTSSGVRFLDNVSLDGPIPVMVADALDVVRRNMSRRALISGRGRRDMWEYPPEALREAIVNALVHRDLSPGSRGNQVQIEMYPDRLRIMNAGGLFGAIDLERLGEDGRSSARNSSLMRLLEEVQVPDDNRTVCENRGSGIRAMIAALRESGMSPPRFRDTTTSFEVVMPNHTLLDDEAVDWLTKLGREGLKDTQCTALALMRTGEVLDNAKYRSATGIADSRTATAELQDLVARELVDQTGTRGGARYTLSDMAKHPLRRRGRQDRRRQLLDLLTANAPMSKMQISEALRINPKTTEHWLRTLKAEGLVEPTEPGRGNKRTRYRPTIDSMQSPLFDDLGGAAH